MLTNIYLLFFRCKKLKINFRLYFKIVLQSVNPLIYQFADLSNLNFIWINIYIFVNIVLTKFVMLVRIIKSRDFR
jgi:hypothetical protein